MPRFAHSNASRKSPAPVMIGRSFQAMKWLQVKTSGKRISKMLLRTIPSTTLTAGPASAMAISCIGFSGIRSNRAMPPSGKPAAVAWTELATSARGAILRQIENAPTLGKPFSCGRLFRLVAF